MSIIQRKTVTQGVPRTETQEVVTRSIHTAENNFNMRSDIFQTKTHAKQMRIHFLTTDLINAEMRVDEIKAEIAAIEKEPTDA